MNEALKSRRWLIPVLALAAVVLVGVGVGVGIAAGRAAAGGQGQGGEGQTSYTRPTVGEDGRVGYATTGVVTTDEKTLQDVIDEMYEKASEPGVALEYKNMAFSKDGQNFECYIGNSEDNVYDMFITIYADQALTDELFLSELLRPGTRFENITLSRKLEPGEHTAYVVYTQVEDEEDKEKEVMIQSIHAQVATTITLVVEE